MQDVLGRTGNYRAFVNSIGPDYFDGGCGPGG